ncbi:MAG: GNAT family N-acetyltransferase [Methanomassiliicoccales archaeon]
MNLTSEKDGIIFPSDKGEAPSVPADEARERPITVRRFRREDYEEVVAILATSFGSKFHSLTGLSQGEMAALLGDSGLAGNEPFEGYLVAEVEGKVLGIMVLRWKGQNRGWSHRNQSFYRLSRRYGFWKVIKLLTAMSIMGGSKVPEGECQIEQIGVSPGARGRGIGRELVDFGSRLVEGKGLRRCSLYVASSNERAIEFYRRLGFAVDREVRSSLTRLLFGERDWYRMVREIAR